LGEYFSLSLNRQESTTRPLRILVIANLEWNPHLGAARVYMQLAEQWRAAGHTVEHFTFSEAFPSGHRSARQFVLQRLLFPRKVRAFVKENAGRFDVIDALVGSFGGSKTDLRFRGLLVARSVGSHRLYDQFERSIPRLWPGPRLGSFLGKIFHSALNHRLMRISDAAIRSVDLINVPNREEADYLRKETGRDQAIIVQPYGLTSETRRALAQAAGSPSLRLAQKRIGFVGMWSARKGSKIFGEIVRRVRQAIPDTQFSFLGTMVDQKMVLADLGLDSPQGVESVPEFSPADLPRLLSNCSVGAFPSYVEGFGLALVEQLAAGLPTVAFDQGGPRDMLGNHLPELLVPTGNVEAFAEALVRILRLDLASYQRLVNESMRIGEKFSWLHIADETLRQYQARLDQMEQRTATE
jgi:glycosyltransferase involved in cell wall biosynthesis